MNLSESQEPASSDNCPENGSGGLHLLEPYTLAQNLPRKEWAGGKKSVSGHKQTPVCAETAER